MFGNKLKIGDKIHFGNRYANWCNQLRVSLYMVMSKNVMLHMGEGDFIMFDEIPISTIKLHVGRFQTFLEIFLSEERR